VKELIAGSSTLLLVAIVVVAVVLLVVLIMLLARAGRKSTFEEPAPEPAAGGDEEPPPEAGAKAGALAMRLAFWRALRRLRRHVSGTEPRYQIPWYLLLGASGSRPADLFSRAGLSLPFGEPEEGGRDSSTGCDFWFFDRGLVIDLGGEYVLRADGRTSEERGWRRFLTLLSRHRARRPLDGVIVTVSARELLAARRRGSEGTAELEERAAGLYRKLWQAQKRLGFRLPVYVLVTGCEAVPGFRGFAGALPDETLGQILGWSSPYSADTAYRPAWVEEAFRALTRHLGYVQLGLYAGTTAAADADGLFLFPGNLAWLEGPLEAWLNQLFKSSAYHEAIVCRGLYFCGSEPLAGAAAATEADGLGGYPLEPGGAGPRPLARTLFLKELLEDKVFREAGLAAPTSATRLAKNRKVLALKLGLVALALLLGIGSYRAYLRLERNRVVLEPFLAEVADHVQEVQALGGAHQEPERDQLRQWAGHLLNGMSRVDVSRFNSLFLPSSLVSRFDLDLHRAVISAYDEIIFKALHLELEHKARDLTSRELPARDRFLARPTPAVGSVRASLGPDVDLLPVDGTGEFHALDGYVADLEKLEAITKLYNGLETSHRLEDLGQVAAYAFGEALPAEYFVDAGLYQAALDELSVPQFQAAKFQPQAAATARSLGEALYRRLFDSNPLVDALDELETALGELVAEGATEGDDTTRFAAVVARIDRLEAVLSQAELEWVFGEDFDLGAPFAQLLGRIEGSSLLGPPVADELQRSGRRSWLQLRQQLAAFETPATGTLLDVEGGRPRMQLSPDVLVLKAAIEAFLGQPFVASSEPEGFATVIRPGRRLVWDVGMLERAAALEEPYQRFRERGLDLFPAPLRPAIEEVAKGRLGARIGELIGRAQSFEPIPEVSSPLLREQEIGSQVGGYAVAAQPLSRLIDLLGRLRLWSLKQQLGDLVALEGVQLLIDVDSLLEAEGLYEPRGRGFAWWDGSAPVSLAAFGVGDAGELAAYLARQRQRLAELAGSYGEPLVKWLGEVGIQRQPSYRRLYRKWESIVRGLHDNETKKPANTLSLLEAYVSDEMAKVTLGHCTPPPAAAAGGEAEDYFVARRDHLVRLLTARCRGLTAARARSEYATVARTFNGRLAGRFPFAAPPAGPFAPTAELADVEAFFHVFDPRREVLAGALAGGPGAFGDSARQAGGFVEALGKVRDFFAPYLDRSEPGAPFTVDVTVDFRVDQATAEGGESDRAPGNPETELGGDRIILWELTIGDRTVTHRDADRRLTWRPGLPVRLALRWAEDSPRTPTSPFLSGDGRTVVYENDGRWSLLSFVLAHPSADPRPQTLCFVIVTEPNPKVASPPPDESPTRVFIRLTLKAPAVEGQVQKTLLLPPFPARAPQLAPAAEESPSAGAAPPDGAWPGATGNGASPP
jgi:type VI secretion system protein ImpL